MATDKNYPIDLPILVIEAQIFVAVKKFPFLPNKQIPNPHQGRTLPFWLFCQLIFPGLPESIVPVPKMREMPLLLTSKILITENIILLVQWLSFPLPIDRPCKSSLQNCKLHTCAVLGIDSLIIKSESFPKM